MHHIELRQFPHNVCRFNLSAEELNAVVEPWARGEWVEMGERKWSPHQARLTVLEGARIPMEQLSMGRGWRAAQRQSEDVTERVLEAVRAADSVAARVGAQAASPDVRDAGDALGRELLPLLGEGAASLLEAWRLLAARSPERRPSECLAAAEEAVRPAGESPS
jgi:hypothetical protein